MSNTYLRFYFSILCIFISMGMYSQITLTQTEADATIGLDRKNWNGGNTSSHSQGYHHDFTLPSAPNPCSKITSITVNVTISSFTPNHPPGCSHTVLYYNMYYGCNPYSGGASCNTSNLIAEPNFPPNTSLPNQNFGCPLNGMGLMADFGGNFSVDVIPVYQTGCNPNWQDAVSMGFVAYEYEIDVTVNFSDITCTSTGCLAPMTTTRACNDGNPCTMNDMETVLVCNNDVICVPCAGIPDPSGGLTVTATPTQTTCGLNNGSISVSPGPAGHTYAWTGGLTGQNPMNVAPGTYTVTVTQSSNGCTGTASVTINNSTPVSYTVTPTNTSCGLNNGSILLTLGPEPHGFIWSGGLSGLNPMGLSPGTYTVTVTQTNTGCSSTASVTINNSTPSFSIIATPTQPTCGLNNGSISVSPGPLGFTYAWTGGLSGQNPTNISPGTYTVTVTQTSDGCTGTASVTINNTPPPFTVTATPTQTSCGLDNGSISVSPGPLGFTYAWTGGLIGQNPTNLSPGTYTVTVTQTSSGCTGTATVVIDDSSPLSVNLIETQPSCGQNNGSISVSPGPLGYTYAWTGGLIGQNPMNLGAGMYTVTVTETSNGCTGTASVTLNASSNLNVVATTTQPSCGLNNGSISVSPGPLGFTYAWTGGLIGQNPMNLGAGTYTVTVTQTSSGCTGTASVTLNASSNLNVVATTTQPSCGQNNGSIAVSPGPGGHTYAWTGGLTGQNPTNLGAGTYTVTVTQTSNGCTGTASVTLNASSSLTVIATATQPSCGQNNGGIAVSPGPAGHTYAWTGGLSGQNPMNLGAGTYTVTVTQTSNGCTGTASVTLNASSSLTVIATATQPSCGQNNGGISVSPGPAGHTYAWTGGLSGQNPMNLGAGTYTVTVTQTSNGCTGTASVTLNASSNLTVIATATQPSCGQNNGSISVSPGPSGHTYAWTGGLSGQNPMNLGAGTYTVTVTQTSNGCTGTASVTLNASSNLTVIATATQPSCGQNNGSISVSPGPAGHTYVWTGGLVGQNPTNLGAGTYTVTVTQTSNGCTGTASVTLNASQTLSINCSSTPSTGPIANDGRISIMMTNGSSPYAISWNGGSIQNIVPNSYTIINLAAANYTITVTDSKGCTATCQSTVNNSDCKLDANITQENIKCFSSSDGKISLSILNAVGNTTINWSNPLWNGQTSISNASANTYSVTISDDLGCQIIKSITLSQPSIMSITCTGIGVSTKGGNDGRGEINVSGGTPNYTTSWSGPVSGQNSGSTPGLITIPNLMVGTYMLTITDANNCIGTCSFFIEDKPCTLTVKADVINPTCYEKCDGAIMLTVDGSVSPIASISWNNPLWDGKTMIDNLCDGTYSVIVTDNTGCSAELSTINVNQPDSLKVSISSSNLTPQPNQEFTLTLTTNIIASDISLIQWSNSTLLDCDNCISPKGKITETSRFSATVTDKNGCIGFGLIDISLWIQNIIHFPNIMTSSSGTNGSFYPQGISDNITGINYLSVYDRWGNMIFNKKNLDVNDPSDGWDGTFSNSKVVPGIYLYISEATFRNGESKIFKGDITVIR